MKCNKKCVMHNKTCEDIHKNGDFYYCDSIKKKSVFICTICAVELISFYSNKYYELRSRVIDAVEANRPYVENSAGINKIIEEIDTLKSELRDQCEGVLESSKLIDELLLPDYYT